MILYKTWGDFMILMCKNNPVFDIEKETVLNEKLLPGMMQKQPSKSSFINWMEKRYSEKSNTYARKLRGLVFGQGNRQKINEVTHALSLSDCYWIKRYDENIFFEQISPYFTDFWTGTGYYQGQAAPTLYVNGYISKYWLTSRILIKAREKHEIECSTAARALGLNVINIIEHPDGIAVENFTNEELMFESAEVSGRLDPDEFTAEDVLKMFGVQGFDMLFFDALIGNGDRHAGNFGYLRDTDTGEYVGMAPLFDFDHAFESNNINDILIQEVREYKKSYADRFESFADLAKTMELSRYMSERLSAM
jgi:hypothetical protein